MARHVGEMIRFYRLRKGMSQEELAIAIGHTGKSSISKIERGENDVNSATMKKIADALGVDPVIFLDQFSADKFAEFHEFLPYLAEASEETIRTIRYMLHMPEKKIYRSSEKIG